MSATIAAGSDKTVRLGSTLSIGSPTGPSTVHFGSSTETGTLILSGPSVQIGSSSTVAIDGGRLVLGSPFNADIFNNGGRVSIAAGATLDLAGFNASVKQLSGGGRITTSAATTTLYLANTYGDSTFAGVLEDGGSKLNVVKASRER